MPANFYPVILAGGRGTRFWPLSRRKRAKQLLALDGDETMIQQTVTRLLPLTAAKQFWIITNQDLRPEIVRQLRKLTPEHVIAEPVARNTAPAAASAGSRWRSTPCGPPRAPCSPQAAAPREKTR